jgi:hypothetical protein
MTSFLIPRQCRESAFQGLKSGDRGVSARVAIVRSVVISVDEARKIALELPEATEQDHHGRPSFRVAGKIFATLWDSEHMNVMLDQPGILTAVQRNPGLCEEVWWGKRLSAVRVDLTGAKAELLADLLADAWEGKAPARLVRDGIAQPTDSRD